jgi:hypothetical protein
LHTTKERAEEGADRAGHAAGDAVCPLCAYNDLDVVTDRRFHLRYAVQVDNATDKASNAKENAKAKTKKGANVAEGKTQEGLDYAKDKAAQGKDAVNGAVDQ